MTPTAVLRLMRFGLAPTAVADSAVLYFLCHADPWSATVQLPEPNLPELNWGELAQLAVVSAGLYGFGMTQNDMVDASRDTLSRKDRPLVTGDLSLNAAWAVAAGCALAAFAAAASLGTYTLTAAGVAFALINAYHLWTKTMGGWGVLNLGLIRLANGMLWMADGQLTWPPFVLFCHVVLMTTTAYRLEGKSPELGRRDAWILGLAGLLVGGVLFAGRLGADWHWSNHGPPGVRVYDVEPLSENAVLLSLLAFTGFTAYLGWTLQNDAVPAAKRGGLLVKNGLLFLLVLDAAVLAVDRRMGMACVLLALPVSWALMNLLRRPPPQEPG